MQTTQVGSHTVAYDDCGAGHPLLLITGLGGTRFGWWKQIEPFSRIFRVIAMDNRDAGDSAPGTGPYTIADMAGDAAGLIKNLNLGPTFVAGISMGGFISLELAIRYPELVEKLILISTSAGGKMHVNPSLRMRLLLTSREKDIEKRVRNVYPKIAAPGYLKAHPEDLGHIIQTAKSKPISGDAYQRQLGAVIKHDAAPRLDRITAPTLVIHGECDPLVPYANGKYLAAHIKGARFSSYPGVGHLLPIEAPERFNREVVDFLAEG
ncbi:MAG: alpha/beta hydrolase [Chloroflexi bacterium]|nr:alpha/beta hydrolase [Chloroflexota bacterium]